MDQDQRAVMRWPVESDVRPVRDGLETAFRLVTTGIVTLLVGDLDETNLSLEALLNKLPIPNRSGALVPPRFPPYFQTEDRERRARMWDRCAEPGSELAKRIQQVWIPLFTPPAPPTYIPKDVFLTKMNEAIQKRFADVTAAVEKLRLRGGKIFFVRFPYTGGLKELEDRITPREKTWALF